MTPIERVKEAIEAFKRGEMVIMADDEDRDVITSYSIHYTKLYESVISSKSLELSSLDV